MTTNDTAAALAKLLDDVACRRCDHDDPIGDVGREEIDRAITAHVAAEVARALACADSVDEAIEAFDETSAAYGAAKRGFDLAARERAAAAQVASIDRLRAAITADKAQAVEAATAHMRPMVSREQAAHLVARFEESIGHELRRRIDGDRKDLIDALAGGEAHPMSDEARRLVEAHHLDLLSIADAVASLHGATGPGLRGHCVAQADKLRLAAGTARAALLRALGVEA